jgi:hypothetical protein|tara:strand:- start:15935 stop:16264 length:330 start_codon:yes stop_codon:yes gene_type:complete
VYDENTAPSTGAAMKEKNVMYDSFDVDGDGTVTVEEMTTISKVNKTDSQKQMAWTAMVVMIVFTAILFLPIFPDERIKVLSDLFGLFYIGMASVVGAYMGMSAWMSKKK